jgi:cytochrome c biogenesis protein CcmG, thiol:disulfide interchange protein DsbE
VSPKSRTSWIAIAAVLVVIGGAFAVNRTTAKKPDAAASPNRATLIANANLPDCPITTGAGKVDRGLPSLTFPCLGNGPKVNLAKLRGPAILNLWAGTCPPCRAEAPLLAQFAAKVEGKVTVLGVVDGAYSGETWDDALDASRGLALHYPSVFDEHGKLLTWTRSAGIPVSLFVDAAGQVAHANFGQLKAGELEQISKQYLGVDVAS